MKNKIISPKKFYAISILVIFSITFLYTGNVLAGDMASVSVTIRFWSPSRAKVSADSLERVISDSVEKESGDTNVKKQKRKSEAYLTVTATVFPLSEGSDDVSNAVGGGGERKKVRKEAADASVFEGMVDIFYDDSI